MKTSAWRAPTSPVWLVTLMMLSLFINYIDRGNLATAALQIREDLHLSNSQYGMLLAGFYFSYTLSQLPSGWLADRFGAKRVLAAGALLWSLSTLLTGFVGGLASLLALRILLGMGESVAFTTTSKLLAANVSRSRLGIANGTLAFGYLVGPAVGTLIGGTLIAHIGWRDVFVLFGALSLLWLVPWSRVRVVEPTTADPTADAAAPTLRQILRERGLWGAAIGHFAGNYNWYFILGYLPMYLEKARGFSTTQMAQVVFAAYFVNAASAMFAGWALDRWVSSGRPATGAYKVVMGLAHVAGLGCMLAMPTASIGVCLKLLFVYEIFLGFSSPGYFSIPQIIAGPAAAARWVGVQNMVGNLPGIIGTFYAGVLIDAEGGAYGTAFALAGAVNLLGLLGWCIVLPRVEPIDWEARRRMA